MRGGVWQVWFKIMSMKWVQAELRMRRMHGWHFLFLRVAGFPPRGRTLTKLSWFSGRPVHGPSSTQLRLHRNRPGTQALPELTVWVRKSDPIELDRDADRDMMKCSHCERPNYSISIFKLFWFPRGPGERRATGQA